MYNRASDEDPKTLDPEAPLPRPRKLLQVPDFLQEDLGQVAFREPENFKV